MKKIITIVAFLPLLGIAQGTTPRASKKSATTKSQTAAKPAAAAAESNEPGFTVTGDVKGLTESSKVFLTDINNPSDTLSRGIVKGGKFVLKGHAKEPVLYELNFGSAKKKVPVFMGNDAVFIIGSIENIKGLTITGSSSNEDFIGFQNIFNPYFARLNAIREMANSPAGAKSADSVNKAYQTTVDTVQTVLDQFLQEKRASFVSPFVMIVLSQLSEDPARQQKRFDGLAPEVQAGFYGQYLQKQIAESKIGAIGSAAIEFSQNDTSGKAISLASYKGKYVLVDFWASWCGPCRMENPNVVATYNKFKDKNFTVLGVSLDKTRDPWLKAIKDDKLTWTHVSDLKYWYNDVAVKYHVQSIPQNFLIGPDGTIVGKNLRGPELESKLCELLGCN